LKILLLKFEKATSKNQRLFNMIKTNTTLTNIKR